jgi:hypothetical protein
MLHWRGRLFVGVENLGLDDVSASSQIGSAPPTANRLEVSVFPSNNLRHTLRARLAEHFELLLTTAGVLVAIILTFAQLDRGTQGMALTFLVWLQGFLIWATRRHSRLYRARLVRKLRVMLQDRVNNQLTVLLAELQALEGASHPVEESGGAMTAARAVADELETLSLESLRSWEARYARHLPAPLR